MVKHDPNVKDCGDNLLNGSQKWIDGNESQQCTDTNGSQKERDGNESLKWIDKDEGAECDDKSGKFVCTL